MLCLMLNPRVWVGLATSRAFHPIEWVKQQ
jgi:hypothetical protein